MTCDVFFVKASLSLRNFVLCYGVVKICYIHHDVPIDADPSYILDRFTLVFFSQPFSGGRLLR